MRFSCFYLWLSVLSLGFLSACDTAEPQEGPLRTNLDAPTLLQPRINQRLPASIAFEWTPVADAARYELELTAESSATAEPSRTSMVAPFCQTELAAGVYSWRVRALDVRERVGYWSAPRHLTVTPR